MTRNILVLGNGAREHAIAWRLAQSNEPLKIFTAPGNPGTAMLGTNLPVSLSDLPGLLRATEELAIDVTIVGPEAPLVSGIVDLFESKGKRIFGPTRAAAMIEGSKGFAKRIINSSGAPTAPFIATTSYQEAIDYIENRGAPIVIKADGLAAGKGVVVAQTVDEASKAVTAFLIDGILGEAGKSLVIEECLSGQEISVFAFTDGREVSHLLPACDYKRIGDHNQGPNTGGMGGYSPPPWWDEQLEEQLRTTCIQPVVQKMADSGNPYRGVLYGGLMLTADGPMIIEFNARLGDPEAELLLPRLETDFLDIVDAVIDGGVAGSPIHCSSDATVGIVLASEGYPASYRTGFAISRIPKNTDDQFLFHAGTALDNGRIVTSGGRVAVVVGKGDSLANARHLAYEMAGCVEFEGKYHRSDIALFT